MNDTNLLENQPIAWTPTDEVIERAQTNALYATSRRFDFRRALSIFD
jgi:hypothetical protein